ncbi:MAG: glycosyltransferase family 4 protein [Sedimentisphaerales bacterium]
MMPIKVLHIIGSLGLGGAQVCLKNLVEHSSNDVEHFIYPLRNNTDIEIKGNVIRFQYPNYDPRKFLAILKLIHKYDIDIVHAHLHKPVIMALLLACFCRVKVVVHEHGTIALRGFQYSLYRILLRILHHNADVFVSVSKNAAMWLRKSGVSEKKIRVIYNAIDSAVFKPDEYLRNNARKILGIEEHSTVIGYVGRLSFEKGPDIIIEAMSILKKQNIHCVLVLAGDGNERGRLQKLSSKLDIEDCVRFLGVRKDVPNVIAACDIGVVPSRFESFGLGAVEFMQMKVPLVCSGVAGLAEVVEDGNTALVPSSNTPANIAESIEKLIKNPALRQVIAENAYEYAQKFSITQQVEIINRLYREILSVKSEKTK